MEITTDDIRKEFPYATEEQVSTVLTWIANAYEAGYDKGSDAANRDHH